MVKSQPQQRKTVSAAPLDGRVRKHGEEHLEMQLYLSKLKELVPNMPKNRKVSKVEVIEHVIDYICDLQMALENHPASRGAAALVSVMLNNNNNNITNHSNSSPSRQPLCVISATPNAFANSCAQEVNPQDKSSTSDCGSRTVSC